MTSIPSRSVLDEYLPGYARERGAGPHPKVGERDLPELTDRVASAFRLPWGDRQRTLTGIADDFGVSMRTLYRYWQRSS